MLNHIQQSHHGEILLLSSCKSFYDKVNTQKLEKTEISALMILFGDCNSSDGVILKNGHYFYKSHKPCLNQMFNHKNASCQMYNSSLIDRSWGKTKTKGAQLIYYIGATIRPITLQKQPILQILAYFKGMDQARYSWPFRSHTKTGTIFTNLTNHA